MAEQAALERVRCRQVELEKENAILKDSYTVTCNPYCIQGLSEHIMVTDNLAVL